MSGSRPLKRRFHSAWHRRVMHLVTRLLPAPRETDAQKLSSAVPIRVLFIRYERIGDLLTATPAIRAIAQSRESMTLDVLAAPENAAILDGNPYVRRVFLFSKHSWRTWPSLWRRLHRERYDVVVDGRANPKRVTAITPLLLRMSGARIRVGAAVKGKESLYTHRVPIDQYAHFARQSAMFAEPFGVNANEIDLRPEIYVTPQERGDAIAVWSSVGGGKKDTRVLVNISALGPLRQWPEDRYVAVLRGLKEVHPDATVIIVSLPTDAERARVIATAARATYVPTSLREVIALVATAHLVFTPDTAISHIGSAFPIPTVVLLPSLPEAPDVLSPDASMPWKTPGRLVRSAVPSLDGISATVALERLLDAMAELSDINEIRRASPGPRLATGATHPN